MSEKSDTFFGISYDTEMYSEPYKDTEFLRAVYESDHAPTYKDIATEIGCSESTIQKYLPNDAQRGGAGLPYERVAMFSGGYDSLVATHYTMTKCDGDVVLHIDTGTGIDKNRNFVEDVCEWFDWDLEVISPTKTLTEFAKEFGFPKSQAHSWIYRYLKEHPLSSFVSNIETDMPEFYTGVRKDESQRRMENVSAEQQSFGGRWIWKAPIAEFSEDDITSYMIEHGLPRNDVVETIGRSGECFCGAFSDRFSELTLLENNYPEHHEWIMDVEDQVQSEIGTDDDYCFWGSAGLADSEVQSLINDDQLHFDFDSESDMTLCADCEGVGHRSIDTNTETVNEQIYVAGPIEGYDRLYDYCVEYDDTVRWINPFELNEYDSGSEAHEHAAEIYEKDLNAVRNSDGLVLRRIDGYNLCGASIEATVAANECDIPVVVFNDADSDIPLMLDELATTVVDDPKDAVQTVCKETRQELQSIVNQPLIT